MVIANRLLTPGMELRALDRSHYQVAILCAPPIEAEAVIAALDKDDSNHEQRWALRGDTTSYTTGVWVGRPVVVIHCGDIGKAAATSAITNACRTFSSLQLVLLVGICGGIPVRRGCRHTYLGDLIISTSIKVYDFGSQLDGHFKEKIEDEAINPRPLFGLPSFLNKLDTETNRQRLREDVKQTMELLAHRHERYSWPATDGRSYYPSDSYHRHRPDASCDCAKDDVCDVATKTSCEALGCDPTLKVVRCERCHQNPGSCSHDPQILFGRVGTADTVVKSGTYRDKVAEEGDLIAFEMEASGSWERLPTIVVKAVSDYADSHKNKSWQIYAAAVAASGAKALLKQWPWEETDEDTVLISKTRLTRTWISRCASQRRKWLVLGIAILVLMTTAAITGGVLGSRTDLTTQIPLINGTLPMILANRSGLAITQRPDGQGILTYLQAANGSIVEISHDNAALAADSVNNLREPSGKAILPISDARLGTAMAAVSYSLDDTYYRHLVYGNTKLEPMHMLMSGTEGVWEGPFRLNAAWDGERMMSGPFGLAACVSMNEALSGIRVYYAQSTGQIKELWWNVNSAVTDPWWKVAIGAADKNAGLACAVSDVGDTSYMDLYCRNGTDTTLSQYRYEYPVNRSETYWRLVQNKGQADLRLATGTSISALAVASSQKQLLYYSGPDNSIRRATRSTNDTLAPYFSQTVNTQIRNDGVIASYLIGQTPLIVQQQGQVLKAWRLHDNGTVAATFSLWG
ncbi:hypothetical protein BDZ85DRAFT_14975 [Elsinoe ampelina]|uniref:Nucleoside phosphorylase domain-containing protein n=1 Tax=Elsinoe ampelina TaxID=302913 RepID=A0A6A6G6M4_9PEZI|nr:hypothetical protein BDZ85DRAFT_14975 [Elsinoe ampelina]